MKAIAYSGFFCTVVVLSVITPSCVADEALGNEDVNRPRQPVGYFGSLGRYLTIEGAKAEGVKVPSNSLLVDTVNGTKLEKPITLVVHFNYVEEHNLERASFNLTSNQRYVFKGYESGHMVGVAPAVRAAAKERGWNKVPMSPVNWEWRPHFVALVVVEPKGVKLGEQNE